MTRLLSASPRALARHVLSPFVRARNAFAALAMGVVVGGCSLVPETPQVVTYDLGPAAAAPASATPLPPLRVFPTDGPSWLDGNAIYYRLHFAQAERLQPYATQRWVMSPVRLFDERMREAIATRGALGWSGDKATPALKVDLLDFEQVFDSATASRGVVRVRATVFRDGMIGQKTFVAEQPAPSADGAGGVKALAASSDAVVAAIMDWVATLPLR
jgi:ABC-type uncharacterized transport system auxiliary subunit